MIKKILTSLVILLSFTGCNDSSKDQATHDAKIAAAAKTELRAELKKEAEANELKEKEQSADNNKLSHLGVTKNGDTITIDTNKTKTFLKIMADNMRKSVDKFAQDMKDGIVDNNEAGIEINHDNISIDLNKTKSFLESWEKTINQYAKEFDKMSNEFDTTQKKDIDAAN